MSDEIVCTKCGYFVGDHKVPPTSSPVRICAVDASAVRPGRAETKECDCMHHTVASLRKKLEIATKALKRVCTEHQSYDDSGGGEYGIGVTDGHRCARIGAEEALREIEGKK